MTIADLERKVAKIDETQKQIVERQDMFERALIQLNENVIGIHNEIELYRKDQTEGWGKTKSIINTLTSTSIGIIMIIFFLKYVSTGGTL